MLLDVDEQESKNTRTMRLSTSIVDYSEDKHFPTKKRITEVAVCDNLYLDMNGIMHPCCHPENKLILNSEEKMFAEIFNYVDRIVSITNPKKLIYLAIDGVAPRAKMNQQRARRYRASRDIERKAAEKQKMRQKLIETYPELEDKFIEREKLLRQLTSVDFDYNCISPGTLFMDNFSTALKGYIADRLSHCGRWKGLNVILSDSSVPGEGEHKIMNYIRTQRTIPDYDPNMTHVIHGMDADLIMLVLATHEEHFYIIRECVLYNSQFTQLEECFLCGLKGHNTLDCLNQQLDVNLDMKPSYKEMEVIKISVLREYLSSELRFHSNNVEWDLCSAINDWIFICFFVGNDFLPHIPTLNVRENVIPLVVELWKALINKWDKYLTNCGVTDIPKLLDLMGSFSELEPKILFQRIRDKNRRNRNELSRSRFGQYNNRRSLDVHKSDTSDIHERISREAISRDSDDTSKVRTRDYDTREDAPQSLSTTWLNDYYKSKFKLVEVSNSFRAEIAEEYIKGLCWVLRYYFQGCASWSWYFPAYYSPFAVDFSLAKISNVQFDQSEPSNPYNQLLSILPPFSANLLPPPFRRLLISEDSPIKDNFPKTFVIDTEDVRFEWQGVVILPFVDFDKIKEHSDFVSSELSAEELARNQFSNDLIFIHKDSPLYEKLPSLNNEEEASLNDIESPVIYGTIKAVKKIRELISTNAKYYNELGLDCKDDNQFIVFNFGGVVPPEGYVFESRTLKGTVPEPSVITVSDMKELSNYNSGSSKLHFYRNLHVAYRPASGIPPSNTHDEDILARNERAHLSSYSRGNHPSYGRGNHPSYGRGNHPSYNRGSQPYHDRGNQPYHDRESQPYHDRGNQPYYDRGNQPYHDRGNQPYYSNYNQTFYNQYTYTRPPPSYKFTGNTMENVNMNTNSFPGGHNYAQGQNQLYHRTRYTTKPHDISGSYREKHSDNVYDYNTDIQRSYAHDRQKEYNNNASSHDRTESSILPTKKNYYAKTYNNQNLQDSQAFTSRNLSPNSYHNDDSEFTDTPNENNSGFHKKQRLFVPHTSRYASEKPDPNNSCV